MIRAIGLLLVLLIGGVAYLYFDRPTPDELGLQTPAPQQPQPGELSVRWLGVSTLLIDDGTTQLLTDGFISRVGWLDLLFDRLVAPDEEAIAAAIELLELDRLAAVMTVHSHFDHAIDTGLVALHTGADVLGSSSTANVARGAGIPEESLTVVSPRETYRYGAFEVRFFAGRHAPLNDGGPPMPGEIIEPLIPPKAVSEWREGGSYTIAITHPEGDILIVGSAGYVAGAHADLDVDAVFLGAGGLSTMPRDYTETYVYESVHLPQAESVYVIHHDDLTAPFGEIRLMPTIAMDSTFVFELQQLVLPAELYALEFNEPVVISR